MLVILLTKDKKGSTYDDSMNILALFPLVLLSWHGKVAKLKKGSSSYVQAHLVTFSV